MSDTPNMDAVRLGQAKQRHEREIAQLRLQLAKQRFENDLAETRAKGPPPARQTTRDLLGATPLGRAALDRQDAAARARGERPNPSGLSDARRRELLGLTAYGNAMLVKEDVARARDGR